MIGLGAFVVEHFSALEADFQRFYRLDLSALLWGAEPVSYRRLAALVRGIPLESALGFSVGTWRPGWSTTDELVATLIEVVDSGNRLFFRANSKRGAQQPSPIKIDRPPDPHAPEKKRRPATSADLVEMFGGAARYTGPPRGAGTESPERPRTEPDVDELLSMPLDDFLEHEAELGPDPVPDPPEVDP